MDSQQRRTLDEHHVGQHRVKLHLAPDGRGTLCDVVQNNQIRFSRAAFMPVALLLMFSLAALGGCDREPGILVDIAEWPDGVERIRVRTTLEGTVGTDISLNKDQTRFAVRLPADSQGTVRFDAIGLDLMGCKLAKRSLTEKVPDNISRFVELPLVLSLLSFHVCVLEPATNFAVGARPVSVAVGDFDGNMKLDLAVANQSPGQMYGNVSVLLSNGMGGFSPATNFDVGMLPYSVAMGDFNGDLKPDLVVANYMSNNVSVLLGNGIGSFSPATNFDVGMGPYSVAVGEFNGDMKLDLVVANRTSNTISVLLGNGVGGFSAARDVKVGTEPRSVAVGDFNGDLRLDLVVANTASDNVSVLLGNGSGGFGMATNFPVVKNPNSVAVGDFNGDMKTDLAVANAGSNDVSVLLGNGSGGFGLASNFLVATNPNSVAVGDFNGDMTLDLAVSRTDNVSVLLGNGVGGFGPPTDFPVGKNPNSVAVGDFNGDLKSDLAVANYTDNNVSVFLERDLFLNLF